RIRYRTDAPSLRRPPSPAAPHPAHARRDEAGPAPLLRRHSGCARTFGARLPAGRGLRVGRRGLRTIGTVRESPRSTDAVLDRPALFQRQTVVERGAELHSCSYTDVMNAAG